MTKKFGIKFDTLVQAVIFLWNRGTSQDDGRAEAARLPRDRDGAVWFETPEARALVGRKKKAGSSSARTATDVPRAPTSRITASASKSAASQPQRSNVWGANTHYHLLQMKIALPALGITEGRWSILLYQYVRFLHEGVLQRMGSPDRAGPVARGRARGCRQGRHALLAAAARRRQPARLRLRTRGAAVERQPRSTCSTRTHGSRASSAPPRSVASRGRAPIYRC